MKKFFAIIPSLFILIFILLVGVYFSFGNRLVVKEVHVELDPESHQQEIFKEIQDDWKARIESLKGKSMIRYSYSEWLNSLEKDPRVKRVLLRRQFPENLTLRILPYDPVLSLVDEKGNLRPIAKGSEVLPRLRSSSLPDTALLRGKDFIENRDLRKRALELFFDLPTEGDFRRSLVSEIRYDKASGFELVLSEPFVTLKLGHENFNERTARAGKVLRYLKNRQIKSRVIDSRFEKKVVVRLRNEP
ncbi:MAG: hypothetical protein CL676_01700 [Bdellovibrionaceae bacterium]|nr:hypothetical protein [Pseudobdellovibrionaceae bacterium]|tara:strand:+ start:1328 stop:2065 length:738 start_codon:yes stop_codon:yes gene_type:complete